MTSSNTQQLGFEALTSTEEPLSEETLLLEDLPRLPVSDMTTSRFDWDWCLQQPYLLALHLVTDLGPRALLKALQKVPTPKQLWESSEQELKQCLPSKALASLLATRQRIEPLKELEHYTHLSIQVLCWGHPDYPRRLLATYAPPPVLFLRGSIQPFDYRALGIVGTRKISPYGQQVVSYLTKELVPYNVCIVSGLAYGVDIAAHRDALRLSLPTIAVLGSGIDLIQPTHHEREAQQILDDGGAIVSEYPLGVPADRFTFPRRNRIIAGLSDGLVVIEGQQKSGSLITANYANEEGRTVFAVPGNIFSEWSSGPHHLIQEGAVLMTQADDIVRELRWDQAFQTRVSGRQTATPPPLSTLPSLQKSKPPETSPSATTHTSTANLSDESTQVLKTIGYDPTPLEVIQHQVGLPMARLSQILTLLELDDHVVSLSGPRFIRKR